MVEKIQKWLIHKNLLIRITVAFLLFFCCFFVVAVISYYLLPTGFLRSKNAILDWQTPNNIWRAAIEIFMFNLISVVIIVLGNLFASLNKNKVFFPNGYIFLAAQFLLNTITLGTWSFTTVDNSPELHLRILRTFDILHRLGLWEMSG